MTLWQLHAMYSFPVRLSLDDMWKGLTLFAPSGLSLRGGGREFPPATMNVFPSYFQRKIKEK